MYQFVVTTVEPLHNGRFGDRRKLPLWRGGRYGEVGPLHDICFSGLSKLMLTVFHNYGRIHKRPELCLEIKRERFETFAISIMRK